MPLRSSWLPFLEVEPGQKVIDTCAGAGGKSLHLAALMENRGQIIAMDIYGHKLTELKKRARRDGIHNIENRVIEGTKTIKKLKGKADRVLIDAPCSGIGVLKRNPDSKWKLEPDFPESNPTDSGFDPGSVCLDGEAWRQACLCHLFHPAFGESSSR